MKFRHVLLRAMDDLSILSDRKQFPRRVLFVVVVGLRSPEIVAVVSYVTITGIKISRRFAVLEF